MLNKKTNKIYKYKKGNIYKDTSTLTGTTTNYKIKDYFDPTKYDFSNFYNHNENYYHVVRFNDFGSCVLEYAESDLNYIFNK